MRISLTPPTIPGALLAQHGDKSGAETLCQKAIRPRNLPPSSSQLYWEYNRGLVAHYVSSTNQRSPGTCQQGRRRRSAAE